MISGKAIEESPSSAVLGSVAMTMIATLLILALLGVWALHVWWDFVVEWAPIAPAISAFIMFAGPWAVACEGIERWRSDQGQRLSGIALSVLAIGLFMVALVLPGTKWVNPLAWLLP